MVHNIANPNYIFFPSKVFILFITDIDELLYSILKVINPSWVETLSLRRKGEQLEANIPGSFGELEACVPGSFNDKQDGLQDGELGTDAMVYHLKIWTN